MATDFTVILENRPGTIAELGEVAGRAGVNLAAICGFPCEGRGVLHVAVDDADADAARTAFNEAGLELGDERPVVMVDIPNEPGALGRVSRRIADAGANVDLLYINMSGQLVVGADNLDIVRSAL